MQEQEFDPAENIPLLENAIKTDERISQWLPRLVPKRISEQEFWRNYFSHISALTKNQPIFATAEEAASYSDKSQEQDEQKPVLKNENLQIKSPRELEQDMIQKENVEQDEGRNEVHSVVKLDELVNGLVEQRKNMFNFAEK